MKEFGDSIQTLKSDFSVLTEENRESIIEMTKFLIITQNNIVPELLHLEKKLKERGSNEQLAMSSEQLAVNKYQIAKQDTTILHCSLLFDIVVLKRSVWAVYIILCFLRRKK